MKSEPDVAQVANEANFFKPQTQRPMNSTGMKNREEVENEDEPTRFARRMLSPFPALGESVIELFNPQSGRLDAERVAAFFGLPLKTLASLLGVSLRELEEAPDAMALQKGLAPFHFVALALASLLKVPEHARMWLQVPNDEFDGETPLDLIGNGEVEVVAGLLRDALVGQPG